MSQCFGGGVRIIALQGLCFDLPPMNDGEAAFRSSYLYEVNFEKSQQTTTKA